MTPSLVDIDRRRRPLPRTGGCPGGGLPPLRRRYGHGPVPLRVGGQRLRRRGDRGRGSAPAISTSSPAGSPLRSPRAWQRSSGSTWRSCRRRRHGLRDRRLLAIGRRPPLAPPMSRPARNARASSPNRPTAATAIRLSPAPTAGPASPSLPTCPTTGRRRPWPLRDVRACAAEYADPADRRFHAQPVACPDCGPVLELRIPTAGTARRDALAQRARCCADGAIVAVKGLGGYHLACDARNEAAVAELRRRKRRGAQAVRVMVRRHRSRSQLAESTTASSGCCPPAPSDRATGPPGAGAGSPIRWLPTIPISASCSPTRPCTRCCSAWPATSRAPRPGDDVGQPWRRADRVRRRRCLGSPGPARRRLAEPRSPDPVPCDDSVSGWSPGRAADSPLARLRPAAVALPFDVPPRLAVGADLKNTCCRRRGPLRLAEPAHRGHGRLRDLGSVRAASGISRC